MYDTWTLIQWNNKNGWGQNAYGFGFLFGQAKKKYVNASKYDAPMINGVTCERWT